MPRRHFPDPPYPLGQFLDFERLLGDAARVGLEAEQYEPFREWLAEHLVDYAPAGSPLREDAGLRRAFGMTVGRALWSALPLPRLDFRCETLRPPERNERCPCGSGEKYKRCCAQAPAFPPLAPGVMWSAVLRALPSQRRAVALGSRHVPRTAILEFAVAALDAGDANGAIEVLEPLLLVEAPRDDDIAEHMLDTLCNAYDERRGAKRRKRTLLERTAALPDRSPLRSGAHQRLACIEMDAGDPKAAWAAFRHAQQDDPGNSALGMLEVQLLMAEGRGGEAQQRARFFLGQLRRRGDQDVDPSLISFYESLSADPMRALSEISFDMAGGAGHALAGWLDQVRGRPVPRYALQRAEVLEPASGAGAIEARLRGMGLDERAVRRAMKDLQKQIAELGAEGPEDAAGSGAGSPSDSATTSNERVDSVLQTPASLADAEQRWHTSIDLPKPFSVHALPMQVGDPWAPAAEARWSASLDAAPESFDSLDILDDLATAAMLHSEIDQPVVRDRLLRPVLDRAIAILDGTLAASPFERPQLRWVFTENRCALRALFRRHEIALDDSDRDGREGEGEREAMALAVRLIDLNPDDNHGVRDWLSGAHLRSDDPQACLGVCERYPDDAAPDLQLNAALALFRLGRARSAGELLRRAGQAAPRVVPYLLEKRIAKPSLNEHGVSLAGDDRGWLYRESMREEWRRTDGALVWAEKILR